MTSPIIRFGVLPAVAAAVAWFGLEGLREISEPAALGMGALFLAVAIPILLRGRR